MPESFITIDLDTSRLDRALADGPRMVDVAAEQAGEQAGRILAPAIETQTPERSGDLKRSERVFQDGPYRTMFEANIYYASFVVEGTEHATFVIPPNPFVERGARDVEVEVRLAFDIVFDAFAENFGT